MFITKKFTINTLTSNLPNRTLVGASGGHGFQIHSAPGSQQGAYPLKVWVRYPDGRQTYIYVTGPDWHFVEQKFSTLEVEWIRKQGGALFGEGIDSVRNQHYTQRAGIWYCTVGTEAHDYIAPSSRMREPDLWVANAAYNQTANATTNDPATLELDPLRLAGGLFPLDGVEGWRAVVTNVTPGATFSGAGTARLWCYDFGLATWALIPDMTWSAASWSGFNTIQLPDELTHVPYGVLWLEMVSVTNSAGFIAVNFRAKNTGSGGALELSGGMNENF